MLRVYLFTTRNLTNAELISCQKQTGDNAFPLLLIDFFSLHIIISNTKKLQLGNKWPLEVSALRDSPFNSNISSREDENNLFGDYLHAEKKLDNHSSE